MKIKKYQKAILILLDKGMLYLPYFMPFRLESKIQNLNIQFLFQKINQLLKKSIIIIRRFVDDRKNIIRSCNGLLTPGMGLCLNNTCSYAFRYRRWQDRCLVSYTLIFDSGQFLCRFEFELQRPEATDLNFTVTVKFNGDQYITYKQTNSTQISDAYSFSVTQLKNSFQILVDNDPNFYFTRSKFAYNAKIDTTTDHMVNGNFVKQVDSPKADGWLGRYQLIRRNADNQYVVFTYNGQTISRSDIIIDSAGKYNLCLIYQDAYYQQSTLLVSWNDKQVQSLAANSQRKEGCAKVIGRIGNNSVSFKSQLTTSTISIQKLALKQSQD